MLEKDSRANPRQQGSARQLGHVEALDGLRGLAILLVLCVHFSDWPPPSTHLQVVLLRIVRCGWIGVDLFFVLSGFLITNVLLNAQGAKNYFRVFYFRRVLRLFPVYYLAVILMFWICTPLSQRPDLLGGFFTRFPLGSGSLSEQLWYWVNISNFHTAFFPYSNPFLTVFWSLAIEEHFYLLWPSCVRFFKAKTILLFCFFGVLAACVIRSLPIVQAENKMYPNFIYRLTPFHIDGLLLGSAMGLIFYNNWLPTQLTRTLKLVLPILFITVGVMLSSPEMEGRWTTKVTYAVVSLLFCTLLWLCVAPNGPGFIRRIFSISLLRKFGRYSYFIYVFHLWVITYLAVARDSYCKAWWPFNQGPAISYAATVLIAVSAVYGLASLSWRFFENPILGLKSRMPYRY